MQGTHRVADGETEQCPADARHDRRVIDCRRSGGGAVCVPVRRAHSRMYSYWSSVSGTQTQCCDFALCFQHFCSASSAASALMPRSTK
jgi:hypothetical protein